MDLLGRRSGRGRLKEVLSGPDPVLAPGAYDALAARLIEQAGFDAIYMTGFGASASLLGRPDIGLLSFGEMVDQARRIAAATSIPVIADADNGYGNELNVIRTVREYESAGVAAIQIEDQVLPKRCGHMEGKQVISSEDMVGKVKAAVDARRSTDCLIVARTDARAVEGIERAIERAARYVEAGADILFIDAPETEQEVGLIGKVFGAKVPVLFNWIEGGKSPPMSRQRLKELGFKLIIFPVTLLFAATRVIRQHLTELRQNGTPLAVTEPMPSLHSPSPFVDFLQLIGMGEVRELEKRYRR